ncbi:hypothetical protein K7432_003231 [Basidiobolus ranarum]|uniref:Uncharacterized protein n=1 Tax=Basidiobolus ranarum TaxID=34480 RepID=A0ABR2X0F9_9FUNG
MEEGWKIFDNKNLWVVSEFIGFKIRGLNPLHPLNQWGCTSYGIRATKRASIKTPYRKSKDHLNGYLMRMCINNLDEARSQAKPHYSLEILPKNIGWYLEIMMVPYPIIMRFLRIYP